MMMSGSTHRMFCANKYSIDRPASLGMGLKIISTLIHSIMASIMRIATFQTRPTHDGISVNGFPFFDAIDTEAVDRARQRPSFARIEATGPDSAAAAIAAPKSAAEA